MSGSKRKLSEGIWEIKQKIAKLATNSIIGNPGFPGINQNILFYLDHESQMAFRQVCQSWKEQVDIPLFWIKKLNRVGQNALSLHILAPQLFFERFIYEMITVWISDHFFKISLFHSEVEVEKRHSNFAQKINERVGLMTWIGIIMSIWIP